MAGHYAANARYSNDTYDFEDREVLSVPLAGVELTRQAHGYPQYEVGGRYVHALGEGTDVEALMLAKRASEDFDSAYSAPWTQNVFSTETSYSETIGRFIGRWTANPKLRFEFATEFARNTITAHTRYSSDGVQIQLPAANVRVSEDRLDGGVKAVWTPFAALSVEGELRAERSTVGSRGDVRHAQTLPFAKPRLQANWAVGPRTKIGGRLERTVGQLNFSDFVASSSPTTGNLSAGNPTIRPQTAWVGELWAEQTFGKAGVAKLVWTQSRLDDVIDRVPVSGAGGVTFDAPGNIGSGRQRDIAASLSMPVDLGLAGQGQLKLQSTWRQSSVTDPVTEKARGISGQHLVDWEVHLIQNLPQLGATWGVDLYGPKKEVYYRVSDLEIVRVGSLATVFLEAPITARTRLRLEAQNILRRRFVGTQLLYSSVRADTNLVRSEVRDLRLGQAFFVQVQVDF